MPRTQFDRRSARRVKLNSIEFIQAPNIRGIEIITSTARQIVGVQVKQLAEFVDIRDFQTRLGGFRLRCGITHNKKEMMFCLRGHTVNAFRA